MERAEVIPQIVLSAHALARIAAQDAKNEAPSAQWRLLGLLEDSAPMRIGALASAARTTQPGMTRLVGELERSGLVVRSHDPQDSRATLVAITDEGREAMRAWRSEFRSILAPRFAGLGEDDWAALERAAEILALHSAETNNTGGME